MALFAKLYTDILGDEKLMRAARNGAKHLQLLPWLIAFAKKADDEGRLTVGGHPADPIDIARNIPSARAKSVALALKELVTIGVLARDASGIHTFTAWERRSGNGKSSDAPSAVAERVRRHRAKKQALRDAAAAESNGNAPSIEGGVKRVTETPDNAREKEKEPEKEKERRDVTPRSASLRSKAELPPLPPNSQLFLDRFYPVRGDRRDDVDRQLRRLLAGETISDKRITVRAYSPARLEAKCREVLDEKPPRDLDAAVAILFTKLADTSDVSAELVQANRDDVAGDERYGDERRALAAAWAAEHPDEAETIRAEVREQYPGDGAYIGVTRDAAFLSAVLRRIPSHQAGAV